MWMCVCVRASPLVFMFCFVLFFLFCFVFYLEGLGEGGEREGNC